MEKIKRNAFLYLEPRGGGRDFAQCSRCALYRSSKRRCMIHGLRLDVAPDASCGFFVDGLSFAGPLSTDVTPAESGLVQRQVRCENCTFFDNGICKLFQKLNAAEPELFQLDEKVKPKACCNAQTPK